MVIAPDAGPVTVSSFSWPFSGFMAFFGSFRNVLPLAGDPVNATETAIPPPTPPSP